MNLAFSHFKFRSFRQIIDGGSTGSRLHVLEFVLNSTDTECVRRGSARANVPLSAFGRTYETRQEPINATYVAEHLLPAFEYASQVIPPHYHSHTPVRYQATAGMRLLDETEQEAVYDALYEGLMESDTFVFRSMQREDIATLSGELEGFYGAVAANYLKGTINADLELIMANHEDDHHGPIGALDMGGSSTQIVFLPSINDDTNTQASSCETTHVDRETCHEATQAELPSRLNGHDFFATSYLSYGVDQFRERLWTTWVQERQLNMPKDACDSKMIENPCTFKGYQIEWHGYTLIGTGDAHKCVEQVQQLIPHPEEPAPDKLGSHVGGVEHPPVRGKFFAMSLFFFTLDSLRELSHPNREAWEALNLSWPTPSIEELYNALDGLCSRTWADDLELIQHDAHSFTRAEVLPHRCLESVYMVTLLRDGFGFHPESRDITFTFLVDGSEVEWSLGMALALRAQEKAHSVLEPTSAEDIMGEMNHTYDEHRVEVHGPILEELAKHLFSSVS